MNRQYVPSLHLDCVNLTGEVQKKKSYESIKKTS